MTAVADPFPALERPRLVEAVTLAALVEQLKDRFPDLPRQMPEMGVIGRSEMYGGGVVVWLDFRDDARRFDGPSDPPADTGAFGDVRVNLPDGAGGIRASLRLDHGYIDALSVWFEFLGPPPSRDPMRSAPSEVLLLDGNGGFRRLPVRLDAAPADARRLRLRDQPGGGPGGGALAGLWLLLRLLVILVPLAFVANLARLVLSAS